MPYICPLCGLPAETDFPTGNDYIDLTHHLIERHTLRELAEAVGWDVSVNEAVNQLARKAVWREFRRR